MAIRKRKRFKNMLSTEKRLEMKINQHKMLMNTLHEMFRKNDVSCNAIETIKAEINDTIKEIEDLRKESKQGIKAATVSMFDNIKKPNGCCGSSTCTCHYNYSAYNPDSAYTDKVLYDSRFIVELDDLNIPPDMVQTVHFLSRSKVEVVINDFLVEAYDRRYPILSIIDESLDRKFTMTIKRTDKTGAVLYKEKYVGCEIKEYFRSSLELEKAEPSKIMLQINFDGVRYETTD